MNVDKYISMRKFTHGYSGIPFMKPNLVVCEFIVLMK